MVNACIVRGCENKQKSFVQTMFHRIPKDEQRRSLWLAALGIASTTPVEKVSEYRVCEEHFKPEDYHQIMTRASGKMTLRLKSTAVPSVFETEAERTASSVAELSFYTPLSCRQDSETMLPELTEQYRIRLKEEELSGLESLQMADSETVSAAPGSNTLEPECVTAHSVDSDVHHSHTSLMKTEADLGSSHTVDVIKTESLDSTEVAYLTHLHLGQIKTEADDGGYLKAEQMSDLQDVKCVDTSCPMKCEYSESLVGNFMDTVRNGAGVDQKDLTEPWKCTGGPEPNCKKEEISQLLTQCEDVTHQWSINNENNQTRTVQKNANESRNLTHCQRTDVIIEPLINPWKSEGCFNTKSDFSRHERIHAGEKAYKCTQCEKYFKSKAYINIHMRIHTGEKSFKCAQCEKSFRTSSHLRRHLRIHSSEKPYKCTHCGKCFTTAFSLKLHLRIHTGEKPYKCTWCQKSFNTASYFKIHLRIHTGEKPYKCTQCGKCFVTKSGLHHHMRIHTGGKPHKCTQCGKCFNAASHLSRHLRVHTGGKPYKCTLCGKCFSTAFNLKVHLRIHAVEKPNKCTQCEKSFNTPSVLSKHLSHTGEKPYMCTHCDKSFTLASNLSRHLNSYR